MDRSIVTDIRKTKPASRPLFWLATRAFLLHSLVTLLGLIWCVMLNQPGFGLLLASLWLCALTIWWEWRVA